MIIIISILAVIISGIMSVIVLTEPSIPFPWFESYSDAPLEKISESCEIYDKDGVLLCKANKKSYLKTDLESIPPHTINAFISIEDSRFYEHGAVDVKRIIAALMKDITTMSAKEGASTITQQLVKNNYLSPEKTILRKLKEVRLAREIERRYSKDEILEFYLNSLYFGNSIYGIETAASRFFNKTCSELTLNESAALAAIINSPVKYDPYKNNDNLEARKRLVLSQMVKYGYITEAESLEAQKKTTFYDKDFNNSFFIRLIMNDAQGKDKIITSYSAKAQELLEENLKAVTSMYDGNYTTAAVIYNAKTEEPIAAASNTYSDTPMNRYSPASTIKPLLCYAPALQEGIISPITPLLDRQMSFNGYTPKNYMDKYYGWVSATQSLAKSLNIPAVKLLDMVGIEKAKTYATQFGLTFDSTDNGLALALGGMKYGVTMNELGKAYCKLACGGKNIVSKESAYLLNKMLAECAETGTASAMSGIGVCAKTGTNGTFDGNSDAWCVAYNTDYVIVVHSYADKLPDNVTGGSVPAKVCAEILKRPLLKSGAFVKPDTVVNLELVASELYDYHRVTIATSYTLPKDRITAEFSIYNLPDRKHEEDLSVGHYENFDIVDSFGD